MRINSKYLLIILFSFIFITVCSCGKEDLTPTQKTELKKETVSYECYICTGGSSKRYHKHRDCRGLSNCGGSIIGMNKTDAINRDRTPCRICFN